MALIHDIALTMIPRLGIKTARQLIDIYGSAEALFALSTGDLRNLFCNREEYVTPFKDGVALRQAEMEMENAQRYHYEILSMSDPRYPQRLLSPDCDDLPTVLYYRGSANLNAARSVAVVGSRKATQYGVDQTTKLINGFKQEDILVVSGLAYGIDSAAHRAAVANQLPTIGVVAHGFQTLYPTQNRELAERMMQQGGILTEYPWGVAPLPTNFPARNRIIAAMSDVVVVAEASLKGGALITANLAVGYHRDLMAFPGRIGDPYSAGCNRLIAANTAQLIEQSDDLFSLMQWQRRHLNPGVQTQLCIDLPPEESLVAGLISSHDGITLEEIKEGCELPLPAIAAALLSLELKGICKCLPGKIYKKL